VTREILKFLKRLGGRLLPSILNLGILILCIFLAGEFVHRFPHGHLSVWAVLALSYLTCTLLQSWLIVRHKNRNAPPESLRLSQNGIHLAGNDVSWADVHSARYSRRSKTIVLRLPSLNAAFRISKRHCDNQGESYEEAENLIKQSVGDRWRERWF